MKCGKFLLEDLVNTQYLWSLLLTGDKSQLIRKDGKAYKSSIVINEDLMINYRKKLINEVLKKNPGIENTVLFKIRNQAYDDIQQAIDKIDLNKEHIFTINLPTGTGKTLCVYGAAFKLFKRLFAESNMRIRPSIIYCLPFTSVIDQNHDVLEKIMAENNIDLSEDFILKHHSMTPIEYHSSIGEEETEYRNYDASFV
jgi:CRISPR-associated endonuclease/helicase Cas3